MRSRAWAIASASFAFALPAASIFCELELVEEQLIAQLRLDRPQQLVERRRDLVLQLGVGAIDDARAVVALQRAGEVARRGERIALLARARRRGRGWRRSTSAALLTVRSPCGSR